MNNMELQQITIQPIIRYPRKAEVGKTYLMTVDVQTELQEGGWPYTEEEYALQCILDTEPLFSHELIGEPVVVLNCFGGTYGSASFILKAKGTCKNGNISVSLVNGQGILVNRVELTNITIYEHPYINLSQIILQKFPSLIAIRYERLLHAKSKEVKTRLAIDVYEVLLRFLTLTLLAQYINKDIEIINDIALNRGILKLFNRPPSLGTWLDIFFTALKAYKGHRDRLFMTQLYDFYWDTSLATHHPYKGIQEVFQKLVQLRNVISHTPLTKDAWQSTYVEVNLHLHSILEQFLFLASYNLIHVSGQAENSYIYDAYAGQQVNGGNVLQTEEDINEGWCYLSKKTDELLSVHPLLILFKEDLLNQDSLDIKTEIVIYDSYRTQRLKYWHTFAGAVTTENSDLLNLFVTLFLEKLEAYRHKRTYRWSWHGLKSLSHKITPHRMGNVRRTYYPELYLQRPEIKKVSNKFLRSDRNCLILTGSAGVGKSNFLLSLIDEFQESKKICVFAYNGADLDPTIPIEDVLAQDFNYHLKFMDEDSLNGRNVLEKIDKIIDVKGQQILLLIDSINENRNGKALLQSINQCIGNYPYPWLKIIVVSRTASWRSIKGGVYLAEHKYFRQQGTEGVGVDGVEITNFVDDIELSTVYNKYRQVFNLATTFEDIQEALKQLLRVPLILLLFSEIYRDREFPQEFQRGNKFSEIYVNMLIQTERLARRDLYFLEREIVHRLVSQNTNVLLITALEDARTSDNRSLYELVFNDDFLSDSGRRVNSSFINLVDTQILKLLDGDRAIAFEFELFYDYFVKKYMANQGQPDLKTEKPDKRIGDNILSMLSRLFVRK